MSIRSQYMFLSVLACYQPSYCTWYHSIFAILKLEKCPDWVFTSRSHPHLRPHFTPRKLYATTLRDEALPETCCLAPTAFCRNKLRHHVFEFPVTCPIGGQNLSRQLSNRPIKTICKLFMTYVNFYLYTRPLAEVIKWIV